MAIEVTCQCGMRLKAQEKHIGKRARCPKCEGELIIGGGHHTYRGMLSQVGADMLEALRGVVSDLKSAGEMEDVDTADYFKFIHEQIQLAG